MSETIAALPRWGALLDLAVTVGLHALADWLNAHAARTASAHASEDGSHDDPEVIDAARILGVHANASADEIRAALRARLATSGLHPDHGGDGDEARRLIDARNLLIARRREVRT